MRRSDFVTGLDLASWFLLIFGTVITVLGVVWLGLGHWRGGVIDVIAGPVMVSLALRRAQRLSQS